MDRWEAIVWMAANARAIIALEWARKLADAVGIPFSSLEEIDPHLVAHERPLEGSSAAIRRKGWAVQADKAGTSLVLVADLAAAMARHIGEFANADQARSSQHGTLGREAQYIGQRACVRLAFHFFGKSGHTDRYGDDPAVKKLVGEVPSIATAGIRSLLKGPDGRRVIGFDGKPVLIHGDQILIEKVYKPQTIEGPHV